MERFKYLHFKYGIVTHLYSGRMGFVSRAFFDLSG